MMKTLQRTPDRIAPHSDRQRGTTLLEVSVVVSVLTVVLGTLGSVLTSSQTAFTETVSSATADEEARRTLDKVVDELRFADLDSVALDAPTDAREIRFRSIRGWDGDRMTSAEKTLTFSNGSIRLDSTPIAARVHDLRMSLFGRILTVELEIQKSVVVQGRTRTITRGLVGEVRL